MTTPSNGSLDRGASERGEVDTDPRMGPHLAPATTTLSNNDLLDDLDLEIDNPLTEEIPQDPEPDLSPSPHTPQPLTPRSEHGERLRAAGEKLLATPHRIRRGVRALWSWGVPGGDMLWLPAVWVWRWRVVALLTAGAAVATGRTSIDTLVTVGTVWLATAVVLSRGAATVQRVASLSRWSAYRKRRRRIRTRWVKMMANGGLVRAKANGDSDKRMPKLRSLRQHPHGVACRVDGSLAGYGERDLRAASPALINTVKATSVRISRVASGRRQGELQLVVKWDDPFPSTIRNSDLEKRLLEIEAARRFWVFKRYNLVLSKFEPVVGLDEERWPTTIDIRKPILVVAASGHGKSTLLWQALWALRNSGLPVLCSVFDPKGGMELGELSGAAWRYVSRSSDWPEFVAAEAAALEADQLRAAREGLQDVPWDAEHPLRFIVVDELVTALMSSRGQEAKIVAFGMERTTQQAFAVLMSQMRAANRSMAAMSTNAEKDVLGAARTMFPQTALGRVAQTEKASVDIMLGSGAHGAYPAHELDPKDMRMRGRFWMRTGGTVTYFRGAQLTADERAEVARWMRGQTDRYRAQGLVDPVPPRSVGAARAQARAQSASARPNSGDRAAGASAREGI